MTEKNLEEIKKGKENKETKIFNINELKIIKNKRKCNNVNLKKEKKDEHSSLRFVTNRNDVVTNRDRIDIFFF